MYIQRRYLRENRTFPDLAGLITVDLPNKGLLSGIEMRIWGTAGVDVDKSDTWLHDMVTKIELIVNGSQVVKSLDGRQLQALMHYQKTPLFSHDFKNVTGAAVEEYWYINLGRFYHDLDYMLDLGRVNDPELRITYNFEMASQNGWDNGEALTVKPSYSMVCHLLRDSDIIPKGYIKSSEVYRFTSAANHQENMPIARGPMYSNLYLQSWYKSEGLTTNLDHIEVNINSDDVIPVRLYHTELLAENVRLYGKAEYAGQCYLQNDLAFPWPMEVGHIIGGGATLVDAQFVHSDLWGLLQTGLVALTSTGGTQAAAMDMRWVVVGAFPFAMAAIPFIDPFEPRTWVDSSKLGDFWVRVEELAGAGTHAIIKLLADEVVTEYPPV